MGWILTTLEIITASRDILIGAAAIVTAIVAICGLKSWSRELKGKAEFEIARSLIRATYKLREALRSSRSPFTSAGEFPENYSLKDRTPKKEAEAWAFVFKKRWEPVSTALQEFEAQALEAEALWGTKIKRKTDELRQCATELQVSMQAMIDDKVSDGEEFKSDPEYA